jgi:hypothetical protein
LGQQLRGIFLFDVDWTTDGLSFNWLIFNFYE